MAKRRKRASEPIREAINWYQTPSGVTIHDEGNPDAWVRMEFTAGVPPEHRPFMVCPECGAVCAQRTKPGNGSVCGDCGTRYDHND